MNFCPFCGKETEEHMSFCPFCGKELAQPQPTKLPKKNPHTGKKLFPLLLIVIAVAVGILLVNPFSKDFSEDPDAINKAADSVVKLYLYDANGVDNGTGSGFAVFDKGVIVTNHHCIDGVFSIQAECADHSMFPIDSVIAYDKEKDIAILRAPESVLVPLKIGDSMSIKRGEETVAIGSPIGLQQMVSTGVFSNYLNMDTYFRILSTASISHGSSGGALFNNQGKVIGITSGGYEAGNNLYYSIPIKYAEELYNSRTLEEEMTLTKFYEQGNHPYTVDYLLAHGNVLHNKDVTVSGYISGIDTDLFLVSSADFVLNIDMRKTFDLSKSMALAEQHSSNSSIQVDMRDLKTAADGLSPNAKITVEGTLIYYGADDVRLIASKVANTQ